VLAAATLAGCSSATTATTATTESKTAHRLAVTSTAFAAGGRIPVRFTCDGTQTSPPLAWSGVPRRARSLALVVDDPDAPGGTFVHWVVLDIPVGADHVTAGRVPGGAVQAENSAGHPAYTGPCPPSGTHHYRFTVYALRRPTGLAAGAGTEEALRQVARDAVAYGRLVGTYRRSG
jgi:Raf kinase inhibitor-like YbhB/YbcL family protein